MESEVKGNMYSKPKSYRDMGRSSKRSIYLSALFLSLLSLVCVAPASAAPITTDELLKEFAAGAPGDGAGQIRGPGGIATSPVTGHVFVTSGNNSVNHARIDEFTPWGEFVKAFGWDVAPGAVNEVQEVRVRATAGQFQLSFESSPTPDLPFNAGAVEVEAALDALPSISSGGGSVDVEAVPGNPITGATPYIYLVTFKGALAGIDVEQLVAADGTTPPSGGDPASGVEASTVADGTSGGTGLESCTTESGCQAGVVGAGPGQFDRAAGIAVGPDNGIYVFEWANRRVQKFDSAGRFEFMFGGGVDQGPHHPGNLCTAAYLTEGDVCGGGSSGSANGEFSVTGESANGDYIDVGPDGTVYVGDKDRIQMFSPEGVYKSQIQLPKAGGLGVPLTGHPGSLSFHPQSNSLYFAFAWGLGQYNPSEVFKLNPATGAVLDELAVDKETKTKAVVAGEDGFIYIGGTTIGSGAFSDHQVYAFGDASGTLVATCCQTERGEPNQPFFYAIYGMATNSNGNLFTSEDFQSQKVRIRMYGPPPVRYESAPAQPPTVGPQWSTAVSTDEATLHAQINPHFWQDTTYYLEYGPADCASNPCAKKPAAPGTQLTKEIVDASRPASVYLDGLTPGTTYHYRFVAQSNGGGPTYGESRSFTTFPPLPPPETGCANQAFRTGFAAALADCRAYEMVSPTDKNNGDIRALIATNGFRTPLYRSATDGEAIAYSSYRAFADPESAPFTSQFIARRSTAGWSSESVSPSRGDGRSFYGNPKNFVREFEAFTPDLSTAWLVHDVNPPLAPGAVPDYPGLYRRDNATGGYEALIHAKPPTSEPANFVPELQGFSEDGSKAVFRAPDRLTPSAASASGVSQVYMSMGGGALRLVSILPDGTAHKAGSSVGRGSLLTGMFSNVTHAVSEDGSRVFWTAVTGSPHGDGAGKIYLRDKAHLAPSKVVGGVCTEASKACTLPVSELVTADTAEFQVAAADGSRVLFKVVGGGQDGDLYEADFSDPTPTTRLIAGEMVGTVVATSDDATRVYFASEEALAGAPQAGVPNLYLSDHGELRYIATLAPGEDEPNAIAPSPVYHTAKATPDGEQLVFDASGSLTGYDNLDARGGEPDYEVFRYDASAAGGVGRLECVSCNPSGQRPLGLRRPPGQKPWDDAWIGSTIGAPASILYTPNSISEDGSRVFFNSYDALVLNDTNGAQDVYEWRALGTGSCAEGGPYYSAANGGCISLISSGKSPADSEFVDAAPDGRDVFFLTGQSLVGQDSGLIDIYDARIGGGFPPPPGPPAPCEGEACQAPPSAPNDPTPASSSFRGTGNANPGKGKPRCPKGKVRRRGRCVAKRAQRTQRAHRRAKHERRASR